MSPKNPYQRIRDLREDADWTQSQVARRLGVAQTTYSDYERAKLNIPVEILIRLADLYHTSLDYLVGRTDERRPYEPAGRKKNP